ncbi:MAG: aminotransferase class V-fold PLP-dependent enzyme [Thermoplasmata archaeon]
MTRARLRSEFPALAPTDPEGSVAYLDSACMSLVPRAVLAAMEEYYTQFPGCAGRSRHRFSTAAGEHVEAARSAFGRWFGLGDSGPVVFLRNATEAINLIARGYPWHRGDRVLISDQEHNSNLVVWQRLSEERRLGLHAFALGDDGSFDLDQFSAEVDRLRPRLISLFHTSNLDGRSLPVRAISEIAHDRGAETLFDGCQAAPHEAVDLKRIGASFYAVSAHKMLGPTGVGVLLSAPGALDRIAPLNLGGETVEWTTQRTHRLRAPPYRFEAGLQNYAGIIGAHAGLRVLERAGLESIRDHQTALNEVATRAFADEPRITILGPPSPGDRPSILGFTLAGVDPHDAAVFLDEGYRVLVRSGQHCVHAWYAERGLTGSVRASFYLYNTVGEARRLVRGIRELLDRIPDRGPPRPVRATGPRSARSPGRGRRADPS